MAGISREQLLALARAGAGARVKELQAELDAILRTFPELRTAAGRRAATKAAPAAAPAAAAKARAWSAADRKAVSQRMKKYWASRKAQGAKTSAK